MALEKVGNLGQIALLERLLAEKHMISHAKEEPITLSEDELEEVLQALRDFQYAVSNLYLNENPLRNDQFGGLVRVIEDLRKKDY